MAEDIEAEKVLLQLINKAEVDVAEKVTSFTVKKSIIYFHMFLDRY